MVILLSGTNADFMPDVFSNKPSEALVCCGIWFGVEPAYEATLYGL
jgi:hypothetical protein